MQKKTGSVDLSAPLTGVLDEISERLVADDWMRCATRDGRSFYYIVGVKAHTGELEGGADYIALSIPQGKPLTVLGEQQVHKQVAAPRSSDYYMRQAVSRLVALGVNREDVERFAKGKHDLSVFKGQLGARGDERLAALGNLMEVLLLAEGIEPEATEAETRAQRADAVQKVYLRELSQLYHKVVQRAASLEVLDLADPQLNEASRCYLYGFFRAAVVLGASALETTLLSAIPQQGINRLEKESRSEDGRKRGYFDLLVDEADRQGLLGQRLRVGEEPYLVVYSRDIFNRRTGVVHKGDDPTAADAEELLNKSREIIEYVRKGSGRLKP